MAELRARRRLRSHGLSYTPEYRAWQTMRLRCTNPRNAAWPDYGGRGITVCEAWLDDPTQFYRDMGPKPSPAHELDRIDNNRGYEPGNCRWVLRTVNCRNRRSNRLLEHAGEVLTVAEWAERTGIGENAIRYRIERRWPASKILTTPARVKAPKGKAKADMRHPCADCGKPVTGARCHTCENKRRAKPRANLDAPVALQVAA